LVAKRGSVEVVDRWPTSVIAANKPRDEHSRKPDVFLDLVERVSPGPYLELFARRRRFGWGAWGDEIDSDVHLAA
jgi:N6-adenosine-specific RNA methylase IME4